MILNGKEVAAIIKDNVKEKINLHLTLAVILVGDDNASKIYVRNKKIACDYVGIKSLVYELPTSIMQNDLLELVHELNSRPDVTGILVQLPLPKHIDEAVIMENINPLKDVDGFNPQNVGALTLGAPKFIPCTPLGIMNLLAHYKISIDGKNCTIIGRSNDVGKPLALLMLAANATVTICHSHTKNLTDITKTADILISAVGKAKFINADMIKSGATLIDVGINRESGKLCGDIDFDSCVEKVANITPVPGGVGPMTNATLMQNCVLASELQRAQ